MIDQTMNSELTEREEIIALLPFYLSGNIEPGDAELVDEWLASDPSAVSILEKIQDERHATIGANEMIGAPRDGLSRLMGDIAKTPQEKTLHSHGRSLGRSLFGWIEEVLIAPLKAAPAELAWAACALLMVVTIGQSALLYQGGEADPNGGSGLELANGARDDILSLAVVKFVPTASMADVATALDEVGAVIVDGPTASGQFTIGFVERAADRSLADRQKALQTKKALVGFFGLKSRGD